MMAGVLIGGRLAIYIPSQSLRLGFGILLIILGIRTLLMKKSTDNQNRTPTELSPFLLFPLGIAGGILARPDWVGWRRITGAAPHLCRQDRPTLSLRFKFRNGGRYLYRTHRSSICRNPRANDLGLQLSSLGNFYALPALVLSVGTSFLVALPSIWG